MIILDLRDHDATRAHATRARQPVHRRTFEFPPISRILSFRVQATGVLPALCHRDIIDPRHADRFATYLYYLRVDEPE